MPSRAESFLVDVQDYIKLVGKESAGATSTGTARAAYETRSSIRSPVREAEKKASHRQPNDSTLPKSPYTGGSSRIPEFSPSASRW